MMVVSGATAVDVATGDGGSSGLCHPLCVVWQWVVWTYVFPATRLDCESVGLDNGGGPRGAIVLGVALAMERVFSEWWFLHTWWFVLRCKHG